VPTLRERPKLAAFGLAVTGIESEISNELEFCKGVSQ